MMIGAINKKNIDITSLQRLGGSKSAEPSPDDDNERRFPVHLSTIASTSSRIASRKFETGVTVLTPSVICQTV
jgi:hypothetical protein